MSITVGIITHPPRISNGLLDRALTSVWKQTRVPEQISIRVDTNKVGAPTMRQTLLASVRTKWLAWLDSDDEFLPHHLQTLLGVAEATGADYVFSMYQVIGGTDPFEHENGAPFDYDNPRQTTTTILVKSELAKECGYARGDDPTGGGGMGEDWRFTCNAMDAGAKIVCVPNVTWLWHHDSENTSGSPSRW